MSALLVDASLLVELSLQGESLCAAEAFLGPAGKAA